MTTPKRYELDLQYGGYGDAPTPMMTEHVDGDYVHHDDYQQLAAKLAEAERDRLHGQFARLNILDGETEPPKILVDCREGE